MEFDLFQVGDQGAVAVLLGVMVVFEAFLDPVFFLFGPGFRIFRVILEHSNPSV